MTKDPEIFSVGLPSRDELHLELQKEGEKVVWVRLRVVGCLSLLRLVVRWRKHRAIDFDQWPLPEGKDHASLLLSELILKAQGRWQSPYLEAELCHCRRVPTKMVEAAIVAGAQNPEQVAQDTSAGTGCGTCRPITQIKDYS